MKPTIMHANRKKSFHLFTLAILGLLASSLFSSCKKEKPDPQPEPSFHLAVSTEAIQAPAIGGSTTDVTIDANAAWTITVPPGISWVEVTKTTGNGNDALQVKVTKDNLTGAVRTAELTVALTNGKAPVKKITVSQDFAVPTPVSLDWKKVLGGNGNDHSYAIIKTPDGGSLIAGRTSSSANNGDVGSTKGGIDMWVVKLDAAGAVAWQKVYGGNGDEYAVAAANTPDGGYVLTGYTTSTNNGDVGQNHGNTDFWVIKINATGTLLWQKTLGGNADDRSNAITITTEGRIAVAGYTTSHNSGDVEANHGLEDMWVMLLDNGNGNFLWKKSFGGNGSEIAKALAPAPNGGVYVGGTTTSNNNGDVGAGKGATDFWVLHLDRNLSIQWKNNFGGTNIDELNALATGPNNMLVAVGSTKSSSTGDVGSSKGGEDVWVVQINANTGALVWQTLAGGNAIDVGKALVVRQDGSVIVAGYTYSANSGDVGLPFGAGDYWVIKLSATGTLGWKKLMGGDDEDLGAGIAETGNGFVITGSTRSHNSGDVAASHGNSDVWVVKLKEE